MFKRSLLRSVLLAAAACISANANLVITPTFDISITSDPNAAAMLAQQIGATHPYVAEMALAATHDGALGGCDDDFEFVFALDLMLDGLERLRDRD